MSRPEVSSPLGGNFPLWHRHTDRRLTHIATSRLNRPRGPIQWKKCQPQLSSPRPVKFHSAPPPPHFRTPLVTSPEATALHCNIQYSAVQYSAVQYSAVYYTPLHCSAVQCSIKCTPKIQQYRVQCSDASVVQCCCHSSEQSGTFTAHCCCCHCLLPVGANFAHTEISQLSIKPKDKKILNLLTFADNSTNVKLRTLKLMDWIGLGVDTVKRPLPKVLQKLEIEPQYHVISVCVFQT